MSVMSLGALGILGLSLVAAKEALPAIAVASDSAAPSAAVVSAVPATPPGLPGCSSPMRAAQELPRGVGETIRYVVSVDALSVGTVDFRIERRGSFGGRPVTEYRSLFKIDSLVAMLIPSEGRAAALVPDASTSPVQAMNKYRTNKNEFEENQSFGEGGRAVSSHRLKDGKPAEEKRLFPGPAQDFVTAFYLLRSLPADARGCAIIYANQRAYTFWIKPEGAEKILTPVGPRQARRYLLRFASEKAKKPYEARLWMSEGPDRLPYRAELLDRRLEARIHLYETGG